MTPTMLSIAIFGGFLVASCSSKSPAPVAPRQASMSDNDMVSAAPGEIATAYATNPASAAKRFGHRSVSVTGRVDGVRRAGGVTTLTLSRQPQPGQIEAIVPTGKGETGGQPRAVRSGDMVVVACASVVMRKPVQLRRCDGLTILDQD